MGERDMLEKKNWTPPAQPNARPPAKGGGGDYNTTSFSNGRIKSNASNITISFFC
jgi:hypothetical protein